MTRRANQGFTLVELMLALAFVGFVMIFAITTVIQVMSTYNKGLALKEINQAARAATEDMARIVRGTSTTTIVTSPLTAPGGSRARVCFGGVSYVWNFTNQTTNRYTDGSVITFARVDDPGNALCVAVSGNYPAVDRTKATELTSDRVWIHQLTVTPAVTGNFMDIFMQLSTADDITSPSLQYDPTNVDPVQRVRCRGGNVGQFCAVANFSETVNARGGY
jgi:prepilin-type N-terminal cleavage/methylation domain-containing protein